MLHLHGILFFNLIRSFKIKVLSDMTPCGLIDQQIQMLLCTEKLVYVHQNARHRIPEDLTHNRTSNPRDWYLARISLEWIGLYRTQSIFFTALLFSEASSLKM